MSFLDKIKKFFNRFSKKDEQYFLPEEASVQIGEENVEGFSNLSSKVEPAKQEPEELQPIELPEVELVSFTDSTGVLDASSRVSQEKFKHNLQILINQAKQKGKIDKFFTIREDNFFPDGWEWRVLSKNTQLEKSHLPITMELNEVYALEQMGIETTTDLMGVKCPRYVPQEEINEALSKVDRMANAVLLPARFRSTKHFTVNTPLELTGDYNQVNGNRDFIIIDNMDNFLQSGYGYSVSYRDAYLDVTHESLPISDEAVVLINDEKYDKIMNDENIASQLAQRKIVRYKGETELAINMILTEKGALPSRVNMRYATYDNEINDILTNSMKGLAEEHGLIYERSHAGDVSKGKGHFSNYFDDKNHDYELEATQFYEFLRKKFPEHSNSIPSYFSYANGNATNLVALIGTKPLIEAVEEYNEMAKARVSASLEKYKTERASITPEIHKELTTTIRMLNEFYKDGNNFQTLEEKWKTEEVIQTFLQGDTLSEQLEAGRKVRDMLPVREVEAGREESTIPVISMEAVIREATTRGIANENLDKCAHALPDIKDKQVSRGNQTLNGGDISTDDR